MYISLNLLSHYMSKKGKEAFPMPKELYYKEYREVEVKP